MKKFEAFGRLFASRVIAEPGSSMIAVTVEEAEEAKVVTMKVFNTWKAKYHFWQYWSVSCLVMSPLISPIFLMKGATKDIKMDKASDGTNPVMIPIMTFGTLFKKCRKCIFSTKKLTFEIQPTTATGMAQNMIIAVNMELAVSLFM